jgi:hypothetical protein
MCVENNITLRAYEDSENLVWKMLEIHNLWVYFKPDKSKPFVRRGQKAWGLWRKIGELLKNKSFVARLYIQLIPKRVLIKRGGPSC